MFCYLASHKLHDAELLLQQCLETVSLPDSRCFVQIRFFVKLPQFAHFLSFSLESRLRKFLRISHQILGCDVHPISLALSRLVSSFSHKLHGAEFLQMSGNWFKVRSLLEVAVLFTSRLSSCQYHRFCKYHRKGKRV